MSTVESTASPAPGYRSTAGASKSSAPSLTDEALEPAADVGNGLAEELLAEEGEIRLSVDDYDFSFQPMSEYAGRELFPFEEPLPTPLTLSPSPLSTDDALLYQSQCGNFSVRIVPPDMPVTPFPSSAKAYSIRSFKIRNEARVLRYLAEEGLNGEVGLPYGGLFAASTEGSNEKLLALVYDCEPGRPATLQRLAHVILKYGTLLSTLHSRHTLHGDPSLRNLCFDAEGELRFSSFAKTKIFDPAAALVQRQAFLLEDAKGRYWEGVMAGLYGAEETEDDDEDLDGEADGFATPCVRAATASEMVKPE